MYFNNLPNLNSMTKYPSIPTYHTIVGEKGELTEEHVDFTQDDDVLFLSQKVDGTNARCIILPDGDFVIGSREELLYAKGDRIVNPKESIVSTILDSMRNAAKCLKGGPIYVIFGEVYGKNIGSNSKLYGGTTPGFRVFDVATIEDYSSVMAMPRDRVSSWREHGGQHYLDASDLEQVVDYCNLELAPRMGSIPVEHMPNTLQETYEWLGRMAPSSLCQLDDTTTSRPEGVVVRTYDRSKIVKIRYEDYERTFRLQKKGR